MGEYFSILSALFFAVSYVLIRKGTTPQSSDNGAFISLLLTFVLSSIFWVIFRLVDPDPIDYLNTEGILWFVLAGLFTTYLGRTWVYLSIRHIGTVRTSAISKLNPFITVLLSAYLVGEPITAVIFLGMLLIFFGVFISIRQSMQLSGNTENHVLNITKIFGRLRSTEIVELGKSFVTSGAYFAILAAVGYALGNTFRKKGVLLIADPFYGASIGALLGILIYVILALFKKPYRELFVSNFTSFKPFPFYAGLAMSLGQIAFFLSLNYIELSRASLITTLDTVFIVILSTWVLKMHENINSLTIISVILTVLGTVTIILG